MTNLQPLLFTKRQFLNDGPIFSNVAVCDNLYPTTCSLSNLHVHEFIEFSIVISGTGIHRIWNDVFECKKGDVFILNTGVPHCYFAANSKEHPTVLNVVFDSKILGEEFSDPTAKNFCFGIFKGNALISHQKLAGEDFKRITDVCHAISNELKDNTAFSSELSLIKLKELLISFSRLASFSTRNQNGEDSSLASKAIRIILNNYYKQDFTLDSLSKMLFVSKAHLSRLLFRTGGEHFSDYVRALRLKRACELLEKTDLSNDQIVFQCGLKDVPTFYKLFKKTYGLTPKQYRINSNAKKV